MLYMHTYRANSANYLPPAIRTLIRHILEGGRRRASAQRLCKKGDSDLDFNFYLKCHDSTRSAKGLQYLKRVNCDRATRWKNKKQLPTRTACQKIISFLFKRNRIVKLEIGLTRHVQPQWLSRHYLVTYNSLQRLCLDTASWRAWAGWAAKLWHLRVWCNMHDGNVSI